MNRTAIASKLLKSLAYNKDLAVLEVEYHSGAVYQYPGVTPQEVEQLLAAKSVGGHFLKHIKPKYQGARVEAEVAREQQ